MCTSKTSPHKCASVFALCTNSLRLCALRPHSWFFAPLGFALTFSYFAFYSDIVFALHQAKLNVVTKPRLGQDNFLSEDLRQLMMDKDETGLDVNADDDLPPLLQVQNRYTLF